MNIALGSDHAGFLVKEKIKEYLKDINVGYKDFGPFSEESVDYPDFGHQVAKALNDDSFSFGVVICGSGNGINMTVNKYSHVRSALCWDVELADLARKHNNANVIAIPARFVTADKALSIFKKFLESEFEGGRHLRRVEKISF